MSLHSLFVPRLAARAARQLRAAAAVLVVLAMSLPWLALPRHGRWWHRLAVLGWRILLRGFGVRIAVRGAISAKTRLFVANHVSWLDIAVIARLLDAGFVAKAEIADWPIIGGLARAYGCAFIARDRRGMILSQARTMARAMDASRPMILFPEGTTSDGTGVLPFRSSLFAAVDQAAGGTVQPVTIAYHGPDGLTLAPDDLRRVAWLADDALLPHAMALAASGGVAVEVTFEEPLAAGCRKSLARLSEQAIAARLAGPLQAAAEANRAA